jgi:hypothetical protein
MSSCALNSVSDKSPQEDEIWPRMKKIKQKNQIKPHALLGSRRK